MAVAVSDRTKRRFRTVVWVLLGLSALALAYSAWRYTRLPVTNGLTPLVISGLFFVVLLALALLRPLEHAKPACVRRRLAYVSALASLLCLAGIAAAWVVVYNQSAVGGAVGEIIRTPPASQAFLAKSLPKGTAFEEIPTGVFIQSFEFSGANNVALSGYIWQRIPESSKAEPGVVLPEAGDAYMATKDPVYDFREGGVRTVGYYFDATLRQNFDYSAYPLDKQNVWLRMWPNKFNTNTVLVPDFSAYPPWQDGKILGVDSSIVYADWNPDFTAYSFANNSYSSTFGWNASNVAGISASSTPEMYFNFGLKRDPQGPLNSQLIRWLFMALIVFGALFLITVDAERREVVGFTTFEVMSFAVGMLLVIIFDQNAIREAVKAKGLVYLEYFSYASYVLILLVGVNAMLLTAKAHIPSLQWGGNLLPKLLYWPLLLGLVLVATLAMFFG